MPELRPSSGVTASGAPTPAAREQVATRLTRHYAADQLSDQQLQALLDRVYAAQTPAELDALLRELPALPDEEGTAVPFAPEREVRALLSGQEQRLSGLVPRRLRLRARLGYVEMDLTRAAFQPGVTEIDVRSFCGYCEIRLPAAVRVESTGHALFGFFSLHQPADDAALPENAPLVRISGRALFGYAECFRSGSAARALPATGATQLPPGEGQA